MRNLDHDGENDLVQSEGNLSTIHDILFRSGVELDGGSLGWDLVDGGLNCKD